MESPSTVSCKVKHPGFFPAYFLDPFDPPVVEATIQVSADTLSFLAPYSRDEARVVGAEHLATLGPVAVEHVTGSAQRLEVLNKSLLRMTLVGSLAFAFFLVFRPYGLGASVLAGLAVAMVIGPLHFLLRGGLAPKADVVRFHFTRLDEGKPFYLETEPVKEADIVAALMAAGMSFDKQPDSNQSEQLGG